MSDDIVEFIETQLAHDKATAHHSGPARVAWLTLLDESGSLRYTTVAASNGDGDLWVAHGRQVPAPASVRIVYDPTSVLADVASKRRIVEACEYAISHYDDPAWGLAQDVLFQLAAGWSGRPGFKSEWRLP